MEPKIVFRNENVAVIKPNSFEMAKKIGWDGEWSRINYRKYWDKYLPDYDYYFIIDLKLFEKYKLDNISPEKRDSMYKILTLIPKSKNIDSIIALNMNDIRIDLLPILNKYKIPKRSLNI